MVLITEQHFDALVVGAGFGGIYQVYTLLKLGISVKLIERDPDVGGTWYHNCYPGALSDTESFVYRYSWDKEDLQTYPWTHHYVRQPEILDYLRHVVAKHDLRKHMQFNTELLSAVWDEDADVWRVTVSTGETYVVRYLITALGLLTEKNVPDIPGLETFKGTIAHSSSWSPDYTVANKRVGVIGCGSTGVQIITAIAPEVAHLTCFQRHPQYSVPTGNKPVTREYRDWVNKHYDEIWEQKVWNSALGFGWTESTQKCVEATAEEREAMFQRLWDRGNSLRFMFEGFGDIAYDRAANDAAAQFIRDKIALIVKDPEKARKLTPWEPYARRPICDSGYFEQFNRDNVDVVDLKETPITTITPDGIRTSDGVLHPLDMIILATGFDVVDGSYARLNIRGRGGESLKERWVDGPTSYLGVFAAGFPNLFMVAGPQLPFANNPPVVELHVDLITDAIRRAERARREHGAKGVVEVSREAEKEWGNICDKTAEGSLFKMKDSWIFGRNIPGKPVATRFYFGGIKNFRDFVKGMKDDGWRGFKPLGERTSML